MDLIEARSDGTEQLLASGLTSSEVGEVLDWWRYTKAFGPGVKILVKEYTGTTFAVSVTGTYVETVPSSSERVPSAAEPTPPKLLVG